MVQQTRAALLAQIAALLPDNVTNQISELDVRTVTGDSADSHFNLLSDTVGTALIDDNAVTHSKYQDIGNNTMLGRVSAGIGNPQELTPAQVRALLNVADGAAPDQNLFSSVATSGQPTITADNVTETLNIEAGTGVNIVNVNGTKTMTISSPLQNLFSTISVAGQPDIIADSASDTLTVAAGTGITITNNDTTDTMTITADDQTMQSEYFTDGVDYDVGVDNSITLASAPSNVNRIVYVNYSGDIQFNNCIASLVGNVLTFTTTIPVGTNQIEVRYLT